ncbi:hypothetical protein D3C87_1675540 [compost metagenome]
MRRHTAGKNLVVVDNDVGLPTLQDLHHAVEHVAVQWHEYFFVQELDALDAIHILFGDNVEVFRIGLLFGVGLVVADHQQPTSGG